MKMLDRTRPFGETFGVHKAKYTQDGAEFDAKGRLLGDRAPKEDIPSLNADSQVIPLDKLSISELKELVQQAGGEYKNRVEAIEFLKDRDNDLS